MESDNSPSGTKDASIPTRSPELTIAIAYLYGRPMHFNLSREEKERKIGLNSITVSVTE